jgi:hypothetical protein
MRLSLMGPISQIKKPSEVKDEDQLFLPGDVFREFVMPFARRRIIGGAQGFGEIWEHWHHWILRCRFLLTQVDDEILDQLMKMSFCTREDYFNGSTWQQHAYGVAGYSRDAVCFMASLLWDQNHLERMMQAVEPQEKLRHYKYKTVAAFAALLLLDNPAVITALEKVAWDHRESEVTGLARYALILYDRRFRTTCASKVDLKSIEARDIIMLDRLMHVGYLIRANIPFQETLRFQSTLMQLLSDTTSPYDRYLGLWDKPVLGRMGDHWQKHFGPQAGLRWAPQKRKFTHISNPDPAFEMQVKRCILAPTPEAEAALLQAIQQEKKVGNLLALLELDQAYQLPASLIDVCFDRLKEQLNVSYHLDEQRAIHLLLRDPDRDAEAATLWQTASTVKARYTSETWEEMRVEIPMLRSG